MIEVERDRLVYVYKRALTKTQNCWHGRIGQKIKRDERRRIIKKNRKEFSRSWLSAVKERQNVQKLEEWREIGKSDAKEKSINEPLKHKLSDRI